MEAVLFDWDGTLADSLESFYAANATVLAEFGLPFDRARYREVYSPDWRVFYRRLGIPEDRLAEVNERWARVFVPAAAPLPGVPDALRRLHVAGARLGLVTATVRAVVEPQIAAFGLADLLAVSICGDDLAVQKPDPAPLRSALAQLGLDDRPARATFVGDAPDDMRMARAAGTRAVGIESMLGERAALLAAGAEEVHASVADWVAALPVQPSAAR